MVYSTEKGAGTTPALVDIVTAAKVFDRHSNSVRNKLRHLSDGELPEGVTQDESVQPFKYWFRVDGLPKLAEAWGWPLNLDALEEPVDPTEQMAAELAEYSDYVARLDKDLALEKQAHATAMGERDALQKRVDQLTGKVETIQAALTRSETDAKAEAKRAESAEKLREEAIRERRLKEDAFQGVSDELSVARREAAVAKAVAEHMEANLGFFKRRKLAKQKLSVSVAEVSDGHTGADGS